MTPKMPQPAKSPRIVTALAVACGVWAAVAGHARAEDGTPAENTETAAPEFVEPADLDWSVLNSDPRSLYESPAAIDRKIRAAIDDPWSWSRTDKPDGSSAVAIKQPITPFWDTRVGADLNVTTKMPMTSSEVLAEKIAHNNQISQSSGSAWAAMTAPGVGSIWDKTAIEARTDPSQEQSKFGTSLSKSLPFGGDQYALTLQHGYNVTQQTLVPVFGLGASSRIYEIDQSAKLGIAETGTSFIAGQTHSSADDKWLRRIGAEQKLFGGVTVTGSVSETPSGAPNSSLTAGFKTRW
ncbi:MAG TPA: hypothetical protein DEA80_01985 [Afipia sp.]|uniref:hypothetical protein n=1 Tax=unclassified Afipia TaxID=2642050 RepID=UPI000463000A|nr:MULTISPECIES: hypothetical protein [unclassified Afipia]MAH68648.1 hypothetical protein [Afipia sp.]OUX62226.1 MAG: hypothetical protein CBB64_05335 [Afipia sp. TMED4]HAO43854.1 hypothetical protein [Afipia sp.]HAP10225.1 hypothetical protein [Afipia sp.]HBF53501.1 hypothetical protein [Afipia sp.]